MEIQKEGNILKERKTLSTKKLRIKKWPGFQMETSCLCLKCPGQTCRVKPGRQQGARAPKGSKYKSYKMCSNINSHSGCRPRHVDNTSHSLCNKHKNEEEKYFVDLLNKVFKLINIECMLLLLR